MDSRLDRIFERPTKRLFRRRIPLEERARAVAAQRTLSLKRAERICYRPATLVEGSRVQQFQLDGFSEHELAALALFHLSPLFKDKSAGLWFGYYHNTPFVNLKIVEKGISFSRNPHDPRLEAQALLNLEFVFRPEYSHLRLSNLRSRRSGRAGTALAALYNLARGLNLPRIKFSVEQNNPSAMRFYLHMDSGAPDNFECTDWTVEIGA